MQALPTMPAATDGQAGWLQRLRLRWAAWRDQRVANPEFRRWAADFPLTRPLVRRSARQLFDLVAGFTYSQVLLACVRLHLFDRLARGPLSADALAPTLQLAPDACLRLLDAGVALRLFSRSGHGVQARYGLGPLGAPMVNNPALAAMVEHHALLYADLADPLAMLRAPKGQTQLGRCFAYARSDTPQALDSREVAEYSAVMAASQPLVTEEILGAYNIGRHTRLLDIGGGEGVFASAAAQRWPQLQVMVFDLPEVARLAHARFERLGLSGRATAHGGDFARAQLPGGADIISLVRVVHDHDDDKVLALLRAARQALPDHGVLLVAEMMADTAGAEAMGDAYFGMYLWAMGSGRPRRVQDISALLQAAGFQAPRRMRNATPLQTQVLIARVGRQG